MTDQLSIPLVIIGAACVIFGLVLIDWRAALIAFGVLVLIASLFEVER